MEDWLLIALIAIEMAFDAIVVAYLAAAKTIPRFESYLDSDRATKYYDRMADRAIVKLQPILTAQRSEFEAMTARLQSVVTENLNKSIEQLTVTLDERIEELNTSMPVFDMGAVSASIRQDVQSSIADLTNSLKEEMVGASKASAMQYLSVLNKDLGKAVAEFEGPFNELGDAMQQEVMNSMSPTDLIKAQILSMELPAKTQKQNPVAAGVFKVGKIVALQGIAAKEQSNTEMNNTVQSKGVSPYR